MMAATFVDDDSLDDQDNDQEQAQFTEEPTQEEDGIPDKYAGKSVQDIVRMHQEAEKLLGRQSAEVGDLRKVVDQYIQTQLTPAQASNHTQQEDPEDEIDFFSDPEKAVQRAIDNHPKVRQAEQFHTQVRKNNALHTLQQKHPDMADILSTPSFGEWVQGSKIRTQLFYQADKQYDYEAADELFTNWKERQGIVSQAVTAEKQTRSKAVRQASTGSASGSTEASSRKVYRRADIIKLMRTDPDRYASLSDEIMKAYSEGRVKS
jgi:hypothetical protein